MTTYTLFGQPAAPTVNGSGAGNNGTNGLHFTVSEACTLEGIWHYSPSTSTELPTSVGVYTTQASPATGTLVTSNTATWLTGPGGSPAAAGSGWVYAALTSPPALASGTNYMAVQFRNDATNEWFVFNDAQAWPVSSAGSVITAPEDTGTGQGWYNTGTALTFPASQFAGFNWWLDVEVSTSSGVTAAGAAGLSLSVAGLAAEDLAGAGVVTLDLAAGGTAAIASPVTSAGAVTLALAADGTAGSASPVTTAVAVSLNLAAAGSARETLTGSGAAGLSLSVAGLAAEDLAGAGAVTLDLAAGSSATVISPVTSAGAVTLALAADGTADNLSPLSNTAIGVISQWDGTQWVPYQWNTPGLYPGSVTTDLIAAGAVTAGQVQAGTVLAGAVDGTTITGGTITGSVFQGTNWTEDSDGMFLYDGTPAEGNLLLSVAPLAGTDAHGNLYQAGVWAYFGSDAVGLWNQGTEPALLFIPANAHMTSKPQVYSFAENDGAANETEWLILTSGKASSNADAAFQMVSEAADGSTAATVIVEFGGTVAATWTVDGLTADSWHDITADSGWTGVVQPQYRLLPDGNVQLRGQMTHASVTADATLNSSSPLPAAYQPAASRFYRGADPVDSAGACFVSSGGVIGIRASASFPVTTALIDGIYSI